MCARLLTVLEFSSSWNVTCAHGWQGGGGLLIQGTATLTNINVYDNQAGNVCSPFELSLKCHPAPASALKILTYNSYTCMHTPDSP